MTILSLLQHAIHKIKTIRRDLSNDNNITPKNIDKIAEAKECSVDI